MKYRDVAKRLRKHGCVSRPGKGSHEIWTSPGGNSVVVPHHDQVTAGVVRDIIAKLTDLPEGWLQ